jgi:hypothetical protein
MPMHVCGPNAQSELSRSLEKALKLVKDFLSCAEGFLLPAVCFFIPWSK